MFSVARDHLSDENEWVDPNPTDKNEGKATSSSKRGFESTRRDSREEDDSRDTSRRASGDLPRQADVRRDSSISLNTNGSNRPIRGRDFSDSKRPRHEYTPSSTQASLSQDACDDSGEKHHNNRPKRRLDTSLHDDEEQQARSLTRSREDSVPDFTYNDHPRREQDRQGQRPRRESTNETNNDPPSSMMVMMKQLIGRFDNQEKVLQKMQFQIDNNKNRGDNNYTAKIVSQCISYFFHVNFTY